VGSRPVWSCLARRPRAGCHGDCGISAEVVTGGDIAQDDTVEILSSAQLCRRGEPEPPRGSSKACFGTPVSTRQRRLQRKHEDAPNLGGDSKESTAARRTAGTCLGTTGRGRTDFGRTHARRAAVRRARAQQARGLKFSAPSYCEKSRATARRTAAFSRASFAPQPRHTKSCRPA
jgi:hypothetical protein